MKCLPDCSPFTYSSLKEPSIFLPGITLTFLLLCFVQSAFPGDPEITGKSVYKSECERLAAHLILRHIRIPTAPLSQKTTGEISSFLISSGASAQDLPYFLRAIQIAALHCSMDRKLSEFSGRAIHELDEMQANPMRLPPHFEPLGSARIQRLGTFLKNKESGIQQEIIKHFQKTTANEIADILKEQGAEDTFVTAVISELDSLKNGKSEQLLLGDWRRDFAKYEKEMLVCLAGNQCELLASQNKQVAALHVREASLHLADRLSPQKKIPIEVTGLERKIQLLLLKHRGDKPEDAKRFVMELLHESQHLIDSYTLDRWVEANQRRLKAGESPDPLFAKYVRIEKDGYGKQIVVIDAAFYRTFMEIRAYGLEAELIAERAIKAKEQARDDYFSPLLIDAIFPEAGKFGERSILEKKNVPQKAYEDLGWPKRGLILDAENLSDTLKIGIILQRMMQMTIAGGVKAKPQHSRG